MSRRPIKPAGTIPVALPPAEGGDRPQPVVPDTAPLAPDATAATVQPGASPEVAAETAAAAVTEAHPTVGDLTAPADAVARAAAPLVKVDGTVPLPADQSTPLVRADGTAVEAAGAAGSVEEPDHAAGLRTPQAVSDAAELAKLRVQVAELEERVRSLTAERAADPAAGERAAILGADGAPLGAQAAERRGFRVLFDVGHDGRDHAPGDTVWLTRDEHAQLLRSTAISAEWASGETA